MTLESPLWLQAGTFSALADRTLLDTLFSSPGVVNLNDLKVSQRGAGANMSVDVAAGSIVITGSDVAEQGKYLCRSSAVTNVSIATAPGAGLSRIDAVYARVRDSSAIGGAFDDWIIAAVTGAAATTGTETAPALPSSAIPLAYVHVPPTPFSAVTGANITEGRVRSHVLQAPIASARMYLNGNLAFLGSATWLRVFPALDFAQGITTTSNQMTIVTPGTYRVTGIVSWANMVATGDATLAAIYVNGSLVRSAQAAATSSLTATPQVSSLLKLAAGDTVQLWMRQNSGVNGGQVAGTSADTWLEAELISLN